MTYQIKSPIPDVSGRSTFGPIQLEFDRGVAEAADLPDGVRAYMLDHGYTVTGGPEKAEASGFDLSAATVPEALTYAESLDADAVAALVDEETAGKGRSSLLDGLAKLQAASVPTPAPEGPETPTEGGEQA